MPSRLIWNRVTASTFGLCYTLAVAAAQTNSAPGTDLLSARDVPAKLAEFVLENDRASLTNIGHAFMALLNQPDAQSTFIRSVTNLLMQSDHTNELLGFINDLHLRPKVFHAKGAPDEAALGFEYDFSKALANRVYLESSAHPLGLSLNVEAKGNVAFTASKNPDDFLESSVSFHFFQGLGGINPLVIEKGPKWFEARNEATKAAGEIPPSPNWRDDPRYIRSAEMIAHAILPQFFYDVRGHAMLESDQKFDNKQYVYGLQAGMVYRDWADTSWVRWLNFFDYPFALIRSIDQRIPIEPSGRALPVILGGVDLVDPSGNDARLDVDPDEDAFPRGRFEVTFKTLAIRLRNQDLWFSASYRYFQEFGASSLIRHADLDSQNYFVLQMDLPYHFNVSYSNGRLPLDNDDDEVYALGWKLNF